MLGAWGWDGIEETGEWLLREGKAFCSFVAGCEKFIVAIFAHLVNILKAPEFNLSADAVIDRPQSC